MCCTKQKDEINNVLFKSYFSHKLSEIGYTIKGFNKILKLAIKPN